MLADFLVDAGWGRGRRSWESLIEQDAFSTAFHRPHRAPVALTVSAGSELADALCHKNNGRWLSVNINSSIFISMVRG